MRRTYTREKRTLCGKEYMEVDRYAITPEEQVPNDTRWSRKQLRVGCTECRDSAYWWEQKYPGWKFVRCVVPEPEMRPEEPKEGWNADDLRCYVVMVRKFAPDRQDTRTLREKRARK